MTYKKWLKENYGESNHIFNSFYTDALKDINFPWNENVYIQIDYLNSKNAVNEYQKAHVESYKEYEKKQNYESEFQKIKNEYQSLREKEREKIVDFLNLNGFKGEKGKPISKHYKSGKGVFNYTSGSTLEKPYDLRIWKYIEAYKDDKYFIISLNALDKDPNSNNIHALFDRISISCNMNEVEKYKITDLELPMNISKMNELLRIMNEIN